MLKLFDLAGSDPARRFSPYCWRIKMALAHKGLAVEAIAWRFTEKDALAPTGQGKVPVLVDGERWLHESWAIAQYLEDAYPQSPSLFGGVAGRALCRHFSDLGDALNAAVAPFLIFDVFKHIDARDRAYFRASREQRFGMPLEQIGADREARLPAFRQSLGPMRRTLSAQPYLGGEQPLYADYALFGAFQWARCISDFQLLAADDPVHAWRERLLGAFDGLARRAPGYDLERQ